MAEAEGRRREGQEGSRWVNYRPDGEEVAAWFTKNVVLDEKLEPDHYVSGVTLINATEKVKETVGFRENGDPILKEVENVVYTPYIKVETRVKYFHDLMRAHGDEWVGLIEPVVPDKPDPALPPGFFKLVVQNAKNPSQLVRYICCSMKVTVFKRDSVKQERVLIDSRQGLYETRRTGEVVIDGAPATKMVPLLDRWGGSDPNAIMKAETGAVGRALGLAGMLVAPGSGVATAEDMEEAQRMEGSSPQGETPQQAELPGEKPALQTASVEELQARAIKLIRQLEEDFPERHKTFLAWCREKEFGKVSELNAQALKGMVRKVEKELDEASKAQQG